MLPILFFAIGTSQSLAQEPYASTGSSTSTVSSSTTAINSGTRSASVAMDVFEESSERSKNYEVEPPQNEGRFHPKDLWVSYPNRRELFLEIQDVINHLTHERKELAFIGLDRIISTQKKLAIRNLPVLSMALARESRIARSQGDNDGAKELLYTAAKISPELFQLHLARLQLSLSSSSMNLGAHAGILADYFQSRVLTFRNQRGLFFETYLLVMISLFLSIIVFTVIQTLKYARYIVYTFARLLPSVFSQVHVAMLGILVLCAPLAFGIGWLLSFGVLVVALWSFQKDSERYVGYFSWLVLLFVPAFLILTSAFISNQKSADQDVLTVFNDADSQRAYGKLLKYSKTSEGQKNLYAHMALAFSDWSDGKYEQSLGTYSHVLTLEPNNPMLLNNKGKLLYFTGKTEAAKKHFQLAVKDGGFAEPLLNYASLVLDEGKFEAAQAALARARRINAELTQSYGDISAGASTAEKLLFISPDESFAWNNLISNGFTQAWGKAFSIFRQTGNPLSPILVTGFLFIVGIIGLILVRNKKILGMYIPCTKCGRPTRWVARSNHCDQCQSVFLRSESIDPAKRQRKKERVERYEGRIALFEKLASVLPGLSDIAVDRAIAGFFRLCIFSFLLLGFLISSEIGASAFGLGTHAFYFLEALFGSFMAVMMLLSVRRVLRA
ncbi:MAG: hypothetical protein VYC39_03530 [Myxococcota bacterium]|nr:hypothetical protein [Myxococcota bacterium]